MPWILDTRTQWHGRCCSGSCLFPVIWKHRKSLDCFWHRKRFKIYTSAWTSQKHGTWYGKWSTIFPWSVRLWYNLPLTNHGKKSTWATWLACPEITETFIALSILASPELPEDIMDKLERYIVLLYSRTSDGQSVNSARLSLFCQMSRPIDNIPPIRASLEEHTRRCIYQGGLIWGHCLEKCPDAATPSNCEWEVDGPKFKPKWTVLPIAVKACLELISCKCMTSCRGDCKCYRANSVSTSLCKCGGTCYVVWFSGNRRLDRYCVLCTVYWFF